MGNRLTAHIAIKGIRPLLWHAFGPEAIPLEKGEKTGVAGNDPEEWRRTVLMTKDRQLYIPNTYAFGCLRDGAKHTKKGRGSIQNNVAATLQVLEDRILVDRFLPEEPIPTDSDELVYLDVRSARNPSTRARNVRYRVAASPGWCAEFTITWDKTIVSRNEMNAVLLDAGQLCGLGDGRTIGMGRFTVERFDVRED